MRAAQYAEYGNPDVLEVVDDAAEPHAGANQVRVAVKAVGVNQADWKIRSGMMAGGGTLAEPKIPGLEVSGVVDQVGEGVDGVAEGDAVFGSPVGGGAARYAVLDAFAVKPDSMSWEEAAGLTVAAETSVRVLDLLGVGEGQTLLIDGGSGGVGQAAIQLAIARGADVIATAGEANQELIAALGAQPTTYGEGLPARVAQLAPAGVDRAFDVAGKGSLPDLIEITGSPDNVVTIADFESSGGLGVRVTSGSEGRSWQALALVAGLAEKGEFSLPVQRIFPLEQIADAQQLSQEGHTRGKLVVLLD